MEKKQALNPFLPMNEYIPDGEPHIFGDRVYLFGSHEEANGSKFCCQPYVFYSAPVDDLSRWTARGISYRPEQDPHWTPERRFAYAPDVVQGNDGRFYLYYCLDGYAGPISAAVCDTPDGEYRYLGDVRNPDGTPYRRFVAFDPGVINDDGIIRLYYGTWFPFENGRTPENSAQFDQLQMGMFGKTAEELQAEPGGVMGPVTVQLANDMLTVVSEPKRIMPPVTTGTDWDAHPFFEGSSIRKIGETYYFIYSTWHNHELCYATSDKPDGGFRFRGVVISNGDVGYQDRRPEDRLWVTGNNHGSIERINGQWYVFYHRHTHARNCCRQACAEPIEILPDGSIPQVEMTSCGLNNGPLRDAGTYPAAICCNLTNGHLPHNEDRNADPAPYPHIHSDETGPFIHSVADETWVGYKYFQFTGPRKLTVTYRGGADGTLMVHNCIGGDVLAKLELAPAPEWTEASVTVPFQARKSGLFLRFSGRGALDLRAFTLA